MTKRERVREWVQGALDPGYVQQRRAAGWRLIAVEWEREAEREEGPPRFIEDIPFGLRIAGDCQHLEEDTSEMQVLMLMMELIVRDESLAKVAEELNRRGLPTRTGTEWGPVSVFNLLPRLIEVGPRIFSSEEWEARRRSLFRVA